MKICPKCRSFYDDETLGFCHQDGIPLVEVSKSVKTFDEGVKFLDESKKLLRRTRTISTITKVFTYLMPVLVLSAVFSVVLVTSEFVENEECTEEKKIAEENLIREDIGSKLFDDIKEEREKVATKYQTMLDSVTLNNNFFVETSIKHTCSSTDVLVKYELHAIGPIPRPPKLYTAKYNCEKNKKWDCLMLETSEIEPQCSNSKEKIVIQDIASNLWIEEAETLRSKLLKEGVKSPVVGYPLIETSFSLGCWKATIDIEYKRIAESQGKPKIDKVTSKYSCCKSETWKCQKISQ